MHPIRLVVLATALAACGGSEPGGPVETGTISGTVRNAADDGLVGVTVRLREAGASADRTTLATSAGGAFSFSAVPVGGWNVYVNLPPGHDWGTQGNPVGVLLEADQTASVSFTLAQRAVSFAGDVQPVFTANCTVGCHGGVMPQQDMSLEAGEAYANTVDVPSNESPLDRIEPGDPEASYLVHKLQGTHRTVGGSGDPMPLGASRLPPVVIDAIRRWIALGAVDN